MLYFSRYKDKKMNHWQFFCYTCFLLILFAAAELVSGSRKFYPMKKRYDADNLP
jgi:hypothetical protein